ncbi:hypothetical protein MMC10_007461 [Thelotrema lepadinum]|nr:hypothetical protein [Thelotrema lepadinum]
MGSIPGTSISRIAIVGGGPSGIATAKFLHNEGCFSDIQVFEQSDSTEGAWKHSAIENTEQCEVPQKDPSQPLGDPKPFGPGSKETFFTTPMYDCLETNIPHQLMQYAEKPFSPGIPLYPPREIVSQYLKDYSTEVLHLIQFHTQVQDVHFLQQSGKDAWSVKTRDLHTGSYKTQIFDAVAVCSGHYNTPYVPDITGIRDWHKEYPASISHSKLYRSPEVYKGKKTVIVGNSASGLDIASQISEESSLPLTISQRSSSWLTGSNSKTQEDRLVTRPQIAEFIPPGELQRAIRFADGHIEEDIDCVLFCTGYLYSFPFLSSFLEELLQDGSRVHNVYQYLFFMDHPSLAFITLPIRVIPFPLSEVQGAVVAKVWSGQLSLPSKQQMLDWERDMTVQNGEGKKFFTLDDGKDFRYHNQLYDWASTVGFKNGIKPHRWTDKELWLRGKFPDVKKAYAQKGSERYNVKVPEELGFNFEKIEAEH